MNHIDVPPYAPVLMESTRAIGYSLETALADIIDNSLAAQASEIDIYFFPIKEPYICILDNGFGMDADELINAMRYGSSNPLDERASNDLGRFGLGLKTASMSQCRKLTVISKKNDVIVGAQWDLDYITLTEKWSLKILEKEDFNIYPQIEKLQNCQSGTLVIWQELDRMKMGHINFDNSMGKAMDTVRDHLSLVFHRYLQGEKGLIKVALSINNILVNPKDPFLSEKSTRMMDDEIIYINNEKIIVRPYILPHTSQLSNDEISILGGKDGIRKQQGFYVYRNKRLLVWGTWFRMMRKGNLSKLARVQIDIPNAFDSMWTLDIKKSMAVPPEIVRKNVFPIIERLGEASKRTWTYRGRKELNDENINTWNRIRHREGGIVYEINRDHPIIKSMNLMDPENAQLLESLLTQVERSLPLNQLYVDLTSDERIENEIEINKNELEKLLKQLLAGCNSLKEREEMADRLSRTSPFNQNPELFSEILQEVL